MYMNPIHTGSSSNGRVGLDLEMRHLKLVLAITEEGSITRAGHRLRLTQSALSHQLRDLEDRLGMQLFTRSNRGLSATDAGNSLLRLARDVVGRVHAAERELAAHTGGRRALLRIATECYTCYHWLPQVLKMFNPQHPLVEVTIEANATGRPLDALREGAIDLALVSSPLTSPKIVTQPLFEDELVAVVSPDHRLSSHSFVRAQDLAEEVMIVYAGPKKDMLVFQKLFFSRNIQPGKVLHVQLTEAIIEMVKACLGVGVLTRWSVEPEVRGGRLVALSLERKGLRRTWSAAYRKQKQIPAHIRDFIEAISNNSSLPRLPASLVAKR